jgi:hypothetical protein
MFFGNWEWTAIMAEDCSTMTASSGEGREERSILFATNESRDKLTPFHEGQEVSSAYRDDVA